MLKKYWLLLMIRMNNFEFRTVFTNDITEKCAKFYIFLWFLHCLLKLWLSKCFQSTQGYKKHQWHFLNCVSSYFRSIVTQNRTIAAKNGCGCAKTACSPRFFKLEIFSFGICLDILQATQKRCKAWLEKIFIFGLRIAHS